MRHVVAGLLALAAAAVTLAPAAGSGTPSVACAAADLDGSAVPAGSTLTVSPAPGGRAASARTSISLLGTPAQSIVAVAASGSVTHQHTGRLEPFSQGDGGAWIPDQPFAAGETVDVSVTVAGARQPVTWSFQIATPTTLVPQPAPPIPRRLRPYVQSFHSRPDLNPPDVDVDEPGPARAPGLLFVAPYSGPGQAGPMIFDDRGQLVWFAPLPPGTQAADFRVQTFHGAPALTWWQDAPDASGRRVYEGVIYDSSYHQLAAVQAGNGLTADHHEFDLGPRDTALIAAYDPIRCDLSAVGGRRDAAVWDGIVQEIDIPTGLVRFEWHALDHVALSESYASARPANAGNPFDFFHINSINPNRDGSLMISARHTWTVYDLDPGTGRVRWRLGGRQSTFAMGPGTQMAWQHDARQLPDGSISVFDNGAVPVVHPQSRGIVMRLDLVHRRARLVERLESPKRLIAGSQGNLQALPDGDWVVGWGQLARVSEFTRTGRLVFDARLPAIEQSYRDFRFAWHGSPTDPPAVALVAAGGSHYAYASWNGATEVASWQVLAGSAPEALRPVASARRTGFETRIAISAGGAVVEARALDAAGRVLGTSAPAAG